MNAGSVLHSYDDNSVTTSFSYGHIAESLIVGTAISSIVGGSALVDLIASVAGHTADGYNFIYGTNDIDTVTVNASLSKGDGFDGSLPLCYVAGEGNDRLTGGSESDVIFGGIGNDIIDGQFRSAVGGDGNDAIIGGVTYYASGGAGADSFWISRDFSAVGSQYVTAPGAYIADSDPGDLVYWNGHLLTGGNEVLLDLEVENTATGFDATYRFGAMDSLGIIYHYHAFNSSLEIDTPDGRQH